ncbi:myc-associated zinc finger protein isoform X1 [Stegostoma tigrinum]|uniref:myc-associated zinc finger protein isoform X1 n=1 Tax=Stegostoma tigrinum TaxID=3053191 RepID=UPI0028701CB4|nr:myc-associated zinc finger protein isoform X1 [Stegostoma tigrinum]XP_059499232.1 myc-associated zinc finger protein isoform X1 [Stegostoma tigrinum]
MEAAWSSFIFPTAAVDQTAGVQADLLPILTATSISQDSSHAPRASDGPLLPERPKEPQPQARTQPDKARAKGPFVCPLCSKEFKNNYNLRRHQRTHSGGGQGQLQAGTNPSPPTMVPIALLSMTMAGVGGGLGSAEAAPQPAGPSPSPARRVRKEHSCELCGKAFRDIYHLNRHKLSHSDEKPFECPICQQRFKRKDRMCYHVRSHEGGVNKPYLCSHCGKGFSRPDHLNSHVRQVHSTERPFKCETCEAAFATKDRLRAHMIRHGEKVPCHVCGKLLSAAYITDHMKVHSEGPNHTCDICNKGFTTVAYLRVHARKHHGISLLQPYRFVCEQCGIYCHTQVQLNGHKGTHERPAEAAALGLNCASNNQPQLLL